jgi:hypothetical protein
MEDDDLAQVNCAPTLSRAISTNVSRYRLEMPDLSNSNLRAEVDLAVVAEAALVGGKPKTHSTWPFLLR